MQEQPTYKPAETLAERLGLAFYEGYHGKPLADYEECGILALHHLYLRAGLVAAQMLESEGTFVPSDDSASVWVSEYLVLPPGITDDKWAVYRSGRLALSAQNTFDFEPSPSARDKKYLKTHRFSQAEALRRAQEVVVATKVAGWTWDDALANYRARKG